MRQPSRCGLFGSDRPRRTGPPSDAPHRAALAVAAAPPVPTVVDRRRRPVFGGAISPAAAAFEHVNDPRDYPAIIDPTRSGLVLRQVGLDCAPGFIRQPEQRTRHLQRPPASAETP